MTLTFPFRLPGMVPALILGALVLISPAYGQTDETIFREFRFDFSTPGARANAMGRAFVGLADEATAAYNNPAGLSVLNSPEFSIEYRFDDNRYPSLKDNGPFVIQEGHPSDTQFKLSRVGFASYAFSLKGYNFSLFYVNNLDYRRDPVADGLRFINEVEDYEVSYLNEHHVRKIRLDTFGFSASHDFGKLDLGLAVGMAGLTMDFNYRTSLNSDELAMFDLVVSEANDQSHRPFYVLGGLYQIHPKLKIGLSYKLQPKFSYTETVRDLTSTSGPEPVQVTFKIPDSAQLGLSWQPNDFWTVLFDVDWVRYRQMVGDNLTVLSKISSFPTPFSFESDDYDISEDPDFRLGAEYLFPLKRHILALRAGGFTDPDHKTRFVGTREEGEPEGFHDVQEYIFNADDKKNNVGYTLGVGFVWNDKLQIDVALVDSDRFTRLVTSMLYRF